MLKFINSTLSSFRESFTRASTYKWFVTIVIGMMVRKDDLGVTSLIRALGLKPVYEALDRFFRSDAWKLQGLEQKWRSIVATAAPLERYKGAAVLPGDGIKVSKEGRRMPGVKRLHQESDNSGKAANIMGQMYGSVGVLAAAGGKTFCIPLACELHDGVKEILSWEEGEKVRQSSHTVEMISLAHRMTDVFPGAIALLDRYFLTVPALKRLDACNAEGGGLKAIIMAKSNAVAYEEPRKTGKGVGRGSKVRQ